MKIIDILVKIANGEEVKFRIIDEQEDYYCKKDDFLRVYRNNQEVDWWLDSLWLNKEVEIIEEEKKIPEKIELEPLDLKDDLQRQIEVVHYENVMISNTINEIIDYLKENNGRN